jgi:hypothetical protein
MTRNVLALAAMLVVATMVGMGVFVGNIVPADLGSVDI